MTSQNYLEGKILLAMPGMGDKRFNRSAIYVCSHDESGAMGIVLNQPFKSLSFEELLEQLDLDYPLSCPDIPIHSGGPVEPGRGFVLHSADYIQESTLVISEHVALSATVDILTAIADEKGPENFIVALGYAGWGAGQLDQEIQQNAWLTAEGEDEIIFHTDLDQKWARSMAMMGIDASMLSAQAGHA